MKKRSAKIHVLKTSVLVLVMGLLIFGLSACTPREESDPPVGSKAIRLGILQYATHPSLDAARDAVLDVLKANGYTDGEELEVVLLNGEGDQPTIRSMAQQLAEDNYDLILAVATPAAQAMANATKDVPILITAVTDPVGAGLVESLDKPNTNVTGTSDYVSIETQLDMVREIVPSLQKLGVIYNSGEENSVVQIDTVKAYAEANGLTVVESTPTNSSEVLQAAQALIGKVDAIYVPTDNTVVSALEAVIKVCNDEQIPLFPGEGDSVERGCIATAGVNYYRLGEQTGKQALKVIEGTKPGDIPVEIQENVSVIVNLKAAKAQGIELPKSVLDRAVEIFDE